MESQLLRITVEIVYDTYHFDVVDDDGIDMRATILVSDLTLFMNDLH